MEDLSRKIDDNRYVVFPCNNCGQYIYVIKLKKSTKCLQCGCSNKLSSSDYYGEMLQEMTNAVEMLKLTQNELPFKVKLQQLLLLFKNTNMKYI